MQRTFCQQCSNENLTQKNRDMRLEIWRKISASLETDVFAQRYALVAVHATTGLALLNDRTRFLCTLSIGRCYSIYGACGNVMLETGHDSHSRSSKCNWLQGFNTMPTHLVSLTE